MCQNTSESSATALSLDTQGKHKCTGAGWIHCNSPDLNKVFKQSLIYFSSQTDVSIYNLHDNINESKNKCWLTHHSQVRPGRVCWRCQTRCSATNREHPRDPNCPGHPGESVLRRHKPPPSAASLGLSGLEIQGFGIKVWQIFSLSSITELFDQ